MYLARRSLLLFVCILALVKLSGCSSEDDASDRPDIASEYYRVLSPYRLFISGDDAGSIATLERAENECMRKRGWDLPLPPASVPSSTPDTAAERRQMAKEGGYFYFNESPEEPEENRIFGEELGRFVESLSESELKKYLDDLSGGQGGEDSKEDSCKREAENSTRKKYPELNPAAMNLAADLWEQYVRGKTFTAATKEWQKCMSKAGFEVEADVESGGPNLVGGRESATAEAKQFEIDVALADASCQEAHIDEIRVRLETDLIQKLAEEFPQYAKRIGTP